MRCARRRCSGPAGRIQRHRSTLKLVSVCRRLAPKRTIEWDGLHRTARMTSPAGGASCKVRRRTWVGGFMSAGRGCDGPIRDLEGFGRELVGAGRFELPTPCSRSKCATRQRHAARLTPSSIATASHPLLSPPLVGVNANSASATLARRNIARTSRVNGVPNGLHVSASFCTLRLERVESGESKALYFWAFRGAAAQD